MKKFFSVFLASVIIIAALPVFSYAKEYVVYQDFESYELSESEISTNACSFSGMAGSSFTVEYAPRSLNKSLHIINDAKELSSSVTANTYMVIDRNESISIELKLLPLDYTQTTVSVSSRVNGSKTFLIISNGVIKPYSGEPNTSIASYSQPYNIGEWLDIKLMLDLNNETYDYYLNDKLICDDLALPGRKGIYTEYGIYRCLIQRSTSKGNYGEAYLDDLRISTGFETEQTETPVIYDEDEEGLLLKWRPVDNYLSKYNPPIFCWPAIPMAESYTIQLSRKPDMSEIKYEYQSDGSYFSPEHTLDVGVWYWRVKGTNINGTTEWSEIKRFRIAQNAVTRIIPKAEDMRSMIIESHPRLWFNETTLEEYRSAMATGDAKNAYETIKSKVDKNLSDTRAEEPELVYPEGATSDEKTVIKNRFRTEAGNIVTDMYQTAFVYMISGEKKYADKAISFLDDIAGWDPYGETSYKNHDQVHRNIALKTAIVYDWLYPLLSETTRQKVLSMIEKRVDVMYKPLILQHPLDELPYDSHGRTASNMIFTISFAVMHDIPAASEWFDNIHSVFYKISSWGGDDGGYANGTGYSNGTTTAENLARKDAIYTATGYDGRDRNYAINYYLYFMSNGAPVGSFGDDATIPPVRESVSLMRYLTNAVNNNNTAAKWASETRGQKPYIDEPMLLKYFNNDVESIPPFDYLNSYYDRDIGWVAMKSDLIDFQHVAIHFKSSWWGSYNHSHADQNSFIIYAYGEPLAVDSGYFDYYYSDHDNYYSKQTLAHNAITINGGNGQPVSNNNPEGNINAKGKITGYLHGDKFNLASGNAERAYPGLDKADRYLIYLKPDYAIVIDELSAVGDNPTQFEFNLKGYAPFEVYEDENKATVTQGRGKLSATFQYPKPSKIEQFDKFIGIDGLEHRPAETKLPRRKDHYGVRFDTEKTPDTVMVTTLDILKAEENEKDVTVNKNDKCMEITVEGNKKIYVRLDYKDEEVSYGNVTFKGTAAVFDGDSFMLVNGTELIKDGVTLVSADAPADFSFEGGELHIFGNEDSNVSFRLPFAVNEIKDENGLEIKSADSEGYDYDTMAYKWTQTPDGIISIEYEAGQYNMYLNGTQPMKYDELTVRINGTPAQYTNQPFSEDGTTYVPLVETVEMYNAVVSVDNGKYTVSKTRESYGDYTERTRTDRTMVLYADSDKAVYNGAKITLNKPTIMKNGILYIPLRAYYEVFTERIGWSDYAKTAWVYTEPVYMDDVSSTAHPRTDIMTEEEYEEYLLKKE